MRTLTEILENKFEYVSEMQRLADTKNAGLIAFNGVIIIGVLTFLLDKNPHFLLFYYFLFVLLTSLIATFLSLTSIVAQIRHKASEVSLHKSDNLLFYGTFAQMSAKELIEALCDKYSLDNSQPALNRDYAKQCIIMGQIAVRKFKLFNSAFLWTIAGVATPISALIFLIFYNPNKK